MTIRMRKHSCVLRDKDENPTVITRKNISEAQREDSGEQIPILLFAELFVTWTSRRGPGDSMGH